MFLNEFAFGFRPNSSPSTIEPHPLPAPCLINVPATISNLHIRAHAIEERLVRTVLEVVLKAYALPCCVVVERRAYTEAAALLGEEAELKRALLSLGRPQSGPWRVEKMAALVAWKPLAHG